MKNILLLCGGGGAEHDVSLVSSSYLKTILESSKNFKVHRVEIGKDNIWRTDDKTTCELNYQKELIIGSERIKIDVAVPCIHGYPGETGELPAFLEVIKLPFVGCGAETSHLCFNKVSTKLWLTALGVSQAPFVFLTSDNNEEMKRVESMASEHGDLFIKAASQGSSVGCYPVKKGEDFKPLIKEAFKFSDYVLVEKMVKGREFEISVYEYDGEIHVSYPGEIICPSGFYSYEEKYAKESKTQTIVRAENLDEKIAQKMKDEARKAFKLMNMKHLCRVDFLVEGDDVYLSEPNTFPGMTPISLFPKMMEANGHDFKAFFTQIIEKAAL